MATLLLHPYLAVNCQLENFCEGHSFDVEQEVEVKESFLGL